MIIVIADDHELIAEGVSSFLKREVPESEIIIALDFHELKRKSNELQFDVLIQDVQFGTSDAREIIDEIKETQPTCKCIALSSHSDEFTVKSVLSKGYDGYVTKNAPMEEIQSAINEVLKGNQYISSDLQRKFFNALFTTNTARQEIQLTSRELEVLKGIQDELSSKEIAEKLFISEKTVETYRANLFAKFQVKNVAGLVKQSLLKGFS